MNETQPKRSYYLIVTSTIFDDDRLNSDTKLLYGLITSLCNEKGHCWASNSYLGERFKKDKRTIQRWLSKLKEYGYIHINFKYKEDTREVEERHISLSYPHDKSVATPHDNSNMTPGDKSVATPHDKSVMYNTKTTNTKEENIKDISEDIFSLLEEEKNYQPPPKKYLTKEQIVDMWNNSIPKDDTGKPILGRLRSISKKRYDKFKLRVDEGMDFTEIVELIPKKPFLLGEGPDGWKIDFDWIIKDDTHHLWVVEKDYGVRKGGNNGRKQHERVETSGETADERIWRQLKESGCEVVEC